MKQKHKQAILTALDSRKQITVNEAAELLGLAPSTTQRHILEKMVSAGLLYSVMAGKETRYEKARIG